jgi:predicted RNA-binding Zn-ribbon protein involved in translation (DUF1610 family)
VCAVDQFQHLYTKYWHQKCPSCGTFGVAAGDEEWEERADDQSNAEYGWEIIERSYLPSEFHCPTCELSLVGDSAMDGAGITESYVEESEEELEYEPDYGND